MVFHYLSEQLLHLYMVGELSDYGRYNANLLRHTRKDYSIPKRNILQFFRGHSEFHSDNGMDLAITALVTKSSEHMDVTLKKPFVLWPTLRVGSWDQESQ